MKREHGAWQMDGVQDGVTVKAEAWYSWVPHCLLLHIVQRVLGGAPPNKSVASLTLNTEDNLQGTFPVPYPILIWGCRG